MWPREDGELSQFVGWLTLTPTQRWHADRQSTGSGQSEGLLALVRELQWPEVAEGTTLRSLQLALRRRGFAAQAVKCDPARFRKFSAPTIIHLRGPEGTPGHFVVWLRAEGDNYIAWDGLAGLLSLTAAEFSERWTGLAVIPFGGPPSVVERVPGFSRRWQAAGGAFLLSGVFVWLFYRCRASGTLARKKGGQSVSTQL